MKTDPIKKHILRYRSVCLYSAGALILAIAAWMQAAAAETTDGPALSRAEQRVVHEAQQAMGAKCYTDAQNTLSDYIQQAKDDVHYLVEFSLGNAWMLDGRPERALPHYRAAVNRHALDAALWQNLGKACYELGRFGEAGECLTKAHALTTPPSPTLAYQAAAAYIQAKRPADARLLLERIVADAKGRPDSDWLEALLKVYLDMGEKDKALDLTRGLVRENGQDPRLWQVLAHLYTDRKAYGKAAAAMEIKAAMTAASRGEIQQLGDLYRMAGVPLKAARQYEKLLSAAVRPEDFERVASAYLAAKHVDAAIDVLKQGVRQYPTPRLWWMLAGAFYEREDFDKALKAFEQCTHDDFRHGEAYVMMGYCALRLDRLVVAEAAFTDAVRFPRQRAEAEQRLKELRRHRLSISMRDDTQCAP